MYDIQFLITALQGEKPEISLDTQQSMNKLKDVFRIEKVNPKTPINLISTEIKEKLEKEMEGRMPMVEECKRRSETEIDSIFSRLKKQSE